MRTRREIRAELEAELAKDGPDLERVEELSAELEQARRRPWRRRDRAPAADRPEATLSDTLLPDGLTEADRAAVETWPPELRARLHDRALTRQILPWRD